MKRLLLVIVSLTFFLAACGESTSPESSTTSSNGNTVPRENLTDAVSDDSAGYNKITAEEAKRIIDEDESYILLDVRTESEYSELRIDGAMLIPHTEIKSRAAEDLPDKNATILVYCRSGIRSAAASESLVQMGYTLVYDIGGIIDWPYETVSDISANGEFP